MKALATLAGAALLLSTANAAAQGWGGQWPPPQQQQPQQQQPGMQPQQQQPGMQQQPGPGYGQAPPYAPPAASKKRDDVEIGFLYATSVAYGLFLVVTGSVIDWDQNIQGCHD